MASARILIGLARRRTASPGYPGEGANPLAPLCRHPAERPPRSTALAVEKGRPPARSLHGVGGRRRAAEGGSPRRSAANADLPMRSVAEEEIPRLLQAFLAGFITLDGPTSKRDHPPRSSAGSRSIPGLIGRLRRRSLLPRRGPRGAARMFPSRTAGRFVRGFNPAALAGPQPMTAVAPPSTADIRSRGRSWRAGRGEGRRSHPRSRSAGQFAPAS